MHKQTIKQWAKENPEAFGGMLGALTIGSGAALLGAALAGKGRRRKGALLGGASGAIAGGAIGGLSGAVYRANKGIEKEREARFKLMREDNAKGRALQMIRGLIDGRYIYSPTVRKIITFGRVPREVLDRDYVDQSEEMKNRIKQLMYGDISNTGGPYYLSETVK